MGPVRRGLILSAVLAALPVSAAAQDVCTTHRPNWDGMPVSALSEAILIFGSPAALILLLASVAVARFKWNWGALVVCVGWSALVSAFTFFDPTGGQRAAAAAEGCIGSPALFIAGAFAICIGLILYVGPPEKKV